MRCWRWRGATIASLVGYALLCSASPLGCDDGEKDGDSTDNGSDTETANQLVPCEELEFASPTTYLVNGGKVSHWNQPGYVDSNGDGRIGEDERVEVEIDMIDICNDAREAGKKTLVLLFGTDN